MRKTVAPAIYILGFILLFAWNSYAGSKGVPPIGGDYFIVGTRTCAYVNNFQDFDSEDGNDFILPDAGGTTRTGHYQGHLYLYGNGTGTWNFYLTQYTHQRVYAGNTPFTAFIATCDVSYEELPNRLVLHLLSGCVAEAVAGLSIGSLSEIPEGDLTFNSSMSGNVLLLSNTRPVIEITRQPDAPQGEETERICSRTLMAIRQSPQ